MRVVVTGGAGFIGRSVIRVLVARGDEVVAIVRDPSRIRDMPGVALVAGDLASTDELRQQFAAADDLPHRDTGRRTAGNVRCERWRDNTRHRCCRGGRRRSRCLHLDGQHAWQYPRSCRRRDVPA
ncbi:MAG: NAD-dependent epimerase/dehydratase family protein [Chloroflexi bacterium]|nr:MAG: NAD-dependent epimerase/dehydratase family protein [Chloroflexota bacterium]